MCAGLNPHQGAGRARDISLETVLNDVFYIFIVLGNFSTHFLIFLPEIPSF